MERRDFLQRMTAGLAAAVAFSGASAIVAEEPAIAQPAEPIEEYACTTLLWDGEDTIWLNENSCRT